MSHHSPNSARDIIVRWLAPHNPYYQELLRTCHTNLAEGELVIDCPQHIISRVLEDSGELEPPSDLLDIRSIELRASGKTLYKIPVGESLQVGECASIDLDIETPTPIGIVRMRDHRGINCTKSIKYSSRAERERWIGTDMSKFHIPEELKRLVNALDTHRVIWGFSYQAIDFEGEPINCVINAHLFEHGGEIYRRVETTHCLRA